MSSDRVSATSCLSFESLTLTSGDDDGNRKRGIRFVVTDGQDWHFMLLRQKSDDDGGGWQAYHSYPDQICWNDNRRDKHAMEYIVRLLVQWVRCF